MTKKYTEEQIVEGFNNFHAANGRYPSQKDLSDSETLPDSKTLERRYGGIVAFRKKFGMGGDNRKNKETYKLREQTRINTYNAYWDLAHYLIGKFGEGSIIARMGNIYIIPSGQKMTHVEVFYPSSPNAIKSSLNYLLKEPGVSEANYIVCLNPDIPEEKLPENVVSLETFKKKLYATN